MANIVLKTYAAGDNNQGSVTPQNDALIYQAAIPTNGIFFGATITLSNANTLHIAAGMGIIGGRFFEVLEDDIAVQLSGSGDLLGRLYIHLDLSNADNPISIETYTGASLPALTGDPNLNASNGSFDMELCTFDINELTISNIVSKFPTITAANNQIRRATAYAVNDFALCQSAGKSLLFICTTAGTTAVSEPMGYTTITDGNTITDGTAVFKAVGLTAEIDRTRAMIAPVLTSLVAPSGGLSTGDQFIYNGLLYKVTAAITNGGTITIDGNCALADCVTKNIITFPDYSKSSLTIITTQGASYIATQKCWAIGNVSGLGANNAQVKINNKLVGQAEGTQGGASAAAICLPLNIGDVFTTREGYGDYSIVIQPAL